MFGSVFVQSSFSRLVRVNNDDQTYQITPFIPPWKGGVLYHPPFQGGQGGLEPIAQGSSIPPDPPF